MLLMFDSKGTVIQALGVSFYKTSLIGFANNLIVRDNVYFLAGMANGFVTRIQVLENRTRNLDTFLMRLEFFETLED